MAETANGARRKPTAKKKTSPGSISRAVPNRKATEGLQSKIMAAIKKSGMSGVELHRETGISLAMSRRLVRGDKTDMKVSTLARLVNSPKIGIGVTA